jgi:hypothetical protein
VLRACVIRVRITQMSYTHRERPIRSGQTRADNFYFAFLAHGREGRSRSAPAFWPNSSRADSILTG